MKKTGNSASGDSHANPPSDWEKTLSGYMAQTRRTLDSYRRARQASMLMRQRGRFEYQYPYDNHAWAQELEHGLRDRQNVLRQYSERVHEAIINRSQDKNTIAACGTAVRLAGPKTFLNRAEAVQNERLRRAIKTQEELIQLLREIDAVLGESTHRPNLMHIQPPERPITGSQTHYENAHDQHKSRQSSCSNLEKNYLPSIGPELDALLGTLKGPSQGADGKRD